MKLKSQTKLIIKDLLSKAEGALRDINEKQYLLKNHIGSIEKYQALAEQTSKQTYEEVDKYELEVSKRIDTKWLNEVALKTQIVIKDSALCYAHGRVLYSALCNYIENKSDEINQKGLTVLETGTARGFSSLCMAKALDDMNVYGKIISIDLLPHYKEIYWNCISDHEKGKLSRKELLINWENLVEKYIIFVQGRTQVELPRIGVSRVNFAFLDGEHTFASVMQEFETIKDNQRKGDIIMFDDYSKEQYPGLVKGIDHICKQFGYKKRIIMANTNRGYALAEKK